MAAPKRCTAPAFRLGDQVHLTGPRWQDYLNVSLGDIVAVDYMNGPIPTSRRAGALTDSDGNFYTGYEWELYTSLNKPPAPVQPTPAQLAAFKEAWEAADKLGLAGQRTRAGLIAVLNLKEPA